MSKTEPSIVIRPSKAWECMKVKDLLEEVDLHEAFLRKGGLKDFPDSMNQAAAQLRHIRLELAKRNEDIP